MLAAAGASGDDEEHGGEKLAEEFDAGAEAVDIIHEAEEDDGGSAEEDAGGDLDFGEADEFGVVGGEEDGDADAGDPAEEDGDAAEVSDGLGVDFSFVIGIIDDAMAMSEGSHDGGEDEGGEVGDVKDGHVGLEDRGEGVVGGGE